jgi:hypothetical protein
MTSKLLVTSYEGVFMKERVFVFVVLVFLIGACDNKKSTSAETLIAEEDETSILSGVEYSGPSEILGSLYFMNFYRNVYETTFGTVEIDGTKLYLPYCFGFDDSEFILTNGAYIKKSKLVQDSNRDGEYYIEISRLPENFDWYMIVDVDSIKAEFYGQKSDYNRTKDSIELSNSEIKKYYEKYIESSFHGATYMFRFFKEELSNSLRD